MVIGTFVGGCQGYILQKTGRQIHLWWLLACIGGWGLGFFITSVDMNIVGFNGITLSKKTIDLLSLLRIWMSVGGVVGFFQWIALRSLATHAHWWILFSALSWPLGWLVSWAIALIVGVTYGAIAGCISESVLGVSLVWLLRRPIISEKDST
jgi:hypothetical protein